MKAERSRARFHVVLLVAGLWLCGCTPKRVVFSSDPVFPPERSRPVRLFLAPPLDSLDLSRSRDAMIRSAGDPARALDKVKCIWDAGVAKYARQLSRDTDLESGVLADSLPYPPTSEWISYSSNALSVPSFSLTDDAALSKFRAAGFDYVVVPQDLSLRSAVGGGTAVSVGSSFYGVPAHEDVYIETPVAVVDLEKRAIVWNGVVSSARCDLAIGSGAFETETYDWLFDLISAFGRKVRKLSSRFGDRGGPCD